MTGLLLEMDESFKKSDKIRLHSTLIKQLREGRPVSNENFDYRNELLRLADLIEHQSALFELHMDKTEKSLTEHSVVLWGSTGRPGEGLALRLDRIEQSQLERLIREKDKDDKSWSFKLMLWGFAASNVGLWILKVLNLDLPKKP